MKILFEDTHLQVISKPAGTITEGPTKNGKESAESLLSKNGQHPVYACHRLDRDTTGVVIFAKTKSALRFINEQFSKRQIKKTYMACVDGKWAKAWNRIETRIRRNTGAAWENADEGKLAITTYRRLAFWNNRSLLQVLPKTGRTHQIRLHCVLKSCPISGDRLYGQRTEDLPSMALHARELLFKHPTSKEHLRIEAPLPEFWHSHWLKDCPLQID
jgi:RluA family pseudouridine synthase